MLPARLLHLGRWLALPGAVLFALAVHWKVNVPPEGMLRKLAEQRSERLEKEAAKKGKKKRKKGRKKGKKKPKAKKGKGAAKAKATGASGKGDAATQHKPRAAKKLTELRKRWKPRPFEDEPELAAWTRIQKPLFERALSLSRKEAFEGSPDTPEAQRDKVECGTVRCSVVLHGPHHHELNLWADVLVRAQLGRRPLFHGLQREVTAPPPSAGPADAGQVYLRVSATFRVDGGEASKVTLGSAK